jgi:hypothetical protein
VFLPYITPGLNRLELFALLTSGVTIYAGLYYLSNDIESETARMALFAIIVLANTVFIVYWAIGMFMSLSIKLAKVKPELAKRL